MPLYQCSKLNPEVEMTVSLIRLDPFCHDIDTCFIELSIRKRVFNDTQPTASL
jgi:hypothetical protein